MKSVYAYIRVSTLKQGESGSSLDEQKRAIEYYAEKHSLNICEWFEETETAAKQGRTKFTSMIALLKKGRAVGVVIHKIDRGARNLRDWADIGGLIDSGIEVHFAHESLDMQSRGGRLAADIQAVVAADFIRNLRDEVRKGFVGRLRQGLYPLPAPLGYDNQGRGLPKTPNVVMAPIIKKGFSLYATGGFSLRTLGEELHTLGLRTRNGGRVTRNGLSTMLNNEFYIGVIHIARMGERFVGIHEPIIKKSTFDQVQNILKGRLKNTGMKRDYIYRKTIRCVGCGYNLTPEVQKGHVYYRCQTGGDCAGTCLREEYIAQQLHAKLDSLKVAENEFLVIKKEFDYLNNEYLEQKNALVASADLQIANIDERMTRLMDAYIDKMIGKEIFETRNKALIHERIEATESLAALRGLTEEKIERTQRFLELLKDISSKDKTLKGEELRGLIKSTTSNFQIDKKEIVITWKKPFEELSLRSIYLNSEPHRTTSRTFPKAMKELSRNLFKKIHSEKPLSD